jgi:hypothetical protein
LPSSFFAGGRCAATASRIVCSTPGEGGGFSPGARDGTSPGSFVLDSEM